MYVFFILSLSAVLSTLITYRLNIFLKQGPVRASAIVAMITGGFFYFFPTIFPIIFSENIPLYVIGGSFIGMVSSAVSISLFSLIISPLLFSILFYYTSTLFHGYGGALGTTACIALMSTMVFPILTKNKKITYGFRLLKILIKKQKRNKKKPYTKKGF